MIRRPIPEFCAAPAPHNTESGSGFDYNEVARRGLAPWTPNKKDFK